MNKKGRVNMKVDLVYKTQSFKDQRTNRDIVYKQMYIKTPDGVNYPIKAVFKADKKPLLVLAKEDETIIEVKVDTQEKIDIEGRF